MGGPGLAPYWKQIFSLTFYRILPAIQPNYNKHKQMKMKPVGIFSFHALNTDMTGLQKKKQKKALLQASHIFAFALQLPFLTFGGSQVLDAEGIATAFREVAPQVPEDEGIGWMRWCRD